MKTLYKITLILLASTLFIACNKDEPIPVNPDFTLSLPVSENGVYTAVVGEPFFVTRTGSGEYITLFDGSEGHIYGDANAKGADFDNKDSISVRYTRAGEYKLTVLATSTSAYGKEITRTPKSVSILAIDKRNSITSFSITIGTDTYQGKIDKDSIIVRVPVTTTDYNFKPVFTLNSPLAKAYVNGVEQVSGTSSNNFSSLVKYSVKSDNGEEQIYTVKFYTFPLSDENKLFRFNLNKPSGSYSSSNGEVGVIDENAKTITLALNYATNPAATPPNTVRYDILASPNSTIYLNTTLYSPRIAQNGFNLSTLKTVTVKAQDGTDNVFNVILTNQEPFSSFTFADMQPQPNGIIDNVNKTIKISVLQGAPITKLKAKWVGTIGKVVVNGVEQVNGVTENDFTHPVVYQIYKGNTIADSYTVTVNVVQ